MQNTPLFLVHCITLYCCLELHYITLLLCRGEWSCRRLEVKVSVDVVVAVKVSVDVDVAVKVCVGA